MCLRGRLSPFIRTHKKYMNSTTKKRIKNFIKNSVLGQYALVVKNRRKFRSVIPRTGSKMAQYNAMFENAKNSSLCADDFFYYHIDTGFKLLSRGAMLSNMPVDYSRVVNSGLRDLLKRSEGAERHHGNSVKVQNDELLNLMVDYVAFMFGRFEADNGEYSYRHAENFKNMLEKPAESIEDACQRILLWNQFIWQSGHNLMGLGRVDKLLEGAYKLGQEKGEDAEEALTQFVLSLHKFYDYKSAALRGDTGQVLELGGLEQDGTYYYNDITLMLIKILRELHLPDPKIILRVSKTTPDEVWESAIQTIASGIGNPLLSNDDVIIPAMIEYYKSADVGYNYATTACWSPVALGCSIGQCNPIMIQMLKSLDMVLESRELGEIKSFDGLKAAYVRNFDRYITEYIAEVNEIQWEEDPLLTFFTEGCEKSGKDISDGGAVYDDYGMQSIGFPNLINSLLNIKKFVFDEKKLDLAGVRDILNSDYKVKPEYERLTVDTPLRFGSDDEETVGLSNEMIGLIGEVIKTKHNKYGKGYKFGISSASYITDGVKTGASFDGRKSGKPLGVQISCDRGAALTEVAGFASRLKYSPLFSNGNVMDVMLNRGMVERDRTAVSRYLKNCIDIGVFQIQVNILSLEELLDAKEHPEDHKDLIVRVWGFNSYFNDLPDEYKDLMIERARVMERN